MKKIKIFIIAGEVSGDVLGAKIMREMPNAEFIGIGGENMQAAGLQSLFSISDLAVMGVVEVLAHVRTLTTRINQTVDAIARAQPDIVLTVDSPGFAKRVIKKVRVAERADKKMPKFYHVVAPQVWAWGAKRARKFAKIFDRLYAFFDFEKPYFTQYGLDTVVIGHPIADGLSPAPRRRSKQAQQNIALIPGSRMSEVKKLLPLMRAAAEQMCYKNPNIWYNFYIPVVETTAEYIRRETANWCTKPALVPSSDRYDLYKKTDLAIVASGTVSAELAIMHVPAIVVYKMNPLTMWLARSLVKVRWVSLVNILLNKTVYPELLGGDATPENVVAAVQKLSEAGVRKEMLIDLSGADNMWRRDKTKTASRLIAEDILN